mmetsp:Transcript_4954/g.12062  ORF Transcript_4954/g.12062 Transcript_4954/m.12062 type:complete len:124 (+) Transcript_4954:654-1025(+)
MTWWLGQLVVIASTRAAYTGGTRKTRCAHCAAASQAACLAADALPGGARCWRPGHWTPVRWHLRIQRSSDLRALSSSRETAFGQLSAAAQTPILLEGSRHLQAGSGRFRQRQHFWQNPCEWLP